MCRWLGGQGMGLGLLLDLATKHRHGWCPLSISAAFSVAFALPCTPCICMGGGLSAPAQLPILPGLCPSLLYRYTRGQHPLMQMQVAAHGAAEANATTPERQTPKNIIITMGVLCCWFPQSPSLHHLNMSGHETVKDNQTNQVIFEGEWLA
jgi:hypothetical protein